MNLVYLFYTCTQDYTMTAYARIFIMTVKTTWHFAVPALDVRGTKIVVKTQKRSAQGMMSS